MTDIRQSEQWAEFMRSIGWEVEQGFFIKKIPILGSVMKIHRPTLPIPFLKIDELAKIHRALFVKIQPNTPEKAIRKAFSDYGYQQDSWPLIPTRSIEISLQTSEVNILNNMSEDARYSIRRADREGIKISNYEYSERTKPFFDKFYVLLKKRGKAKKFQVQKKKEYDARLSSFNKAALLILAYKGSETPLAGALIMIYKDKAYYLQAASTETGRKNLAPYLIVWEAIKLAKKKGCGIFDLEGIDDPRYKTFKKWKTFSIFKRKFGGTEITYLGAFIKYYNPIAKFLFNITS